MLVESVPYKQMTYDEIVDAFIVLGLEIDKCEESTCFSDVENLADLIEAGYFHFMDWHAGQWSQEYQALSILGRIFQPGHNQTEPCDEQGLHFYRQLGLLAEASAKRKNDAR
jgi:hypothetical protein